MSNAMRADITLTHDIQPYMAEALALDAAATRYEDAFLFDDPADAATFRRFLCEHNLAAFSPPHGLLALIDGRPIGLAAGMTRREVLSRRLALAMALHREPPLPRDAGLIERLRQVEASHPVVHDGDFAWSRISVAPSFAGQRSARLLADAMAARARELGCTRIVGEIAAANEASLRYIEKLGYREIGRGSAVDTRRGRRLDYIHMAGPIPSVAAAEATR
jgi:GNAT superfamily N-acetyltransferase